jgi:hypothetical protein
MGSFDETCSVSNLPVSWKEPCLVFVIVPHWFLPLHYQARWEPEIVVPFKGTYDDYGKLENLDLSPAFLAQQQTLLAKALDFDGEAKERHSEILKRYPDDPSALLELCERGVFRVRNAHGERTTAPFYVREDVFQYVVEETANFENWRGNWGEQTRTTVESRLEYLDTWGKYIDALKAEADDVDELRERTMSLKERDNLQGSHLCHKLLMDHHGKMKEDPSLRESLAQAMTEFELFWMGLELFHVDWMPRLFRGQCPDFNLHAKWHRDLAEMARASEKRMEED